MTTLKEFYHMLKRHDWYHMYSDDGGIWRAGEANEKRLAEIAKESTEHSKLMTEFSQHYFSGEPWKTPKAPMPKEPE